MKTQIIPYGTTHAVRIEKADAQMIIAICDEINEGFVLLNHGKKDLPAPGDKGTIVFLRGGPNKGYWDFNPEKIKGIRKVQGPHDFPSNSKIID